MSGGTSEGSHKMGHTQSLKTYTLVFGGLLILTIITVWVSQYDFGFFNDIIAMTIAVGKASLVILFFMHGRYEGSITWAFIYYPVLLLLILLGALYLDYGNRYDRDRVIQEPIIAQPIHHDKDGGHGESGAHGAAGDHDGDADHGDAAGDNDAGHGDASGDQGDGSGDNGDQGDGSGDQ